MPRTKLKLDIPYLTSRQQRRNFLTELNNIRNQPNNINSLKVENDIVREANVPDSIEQLPQQQSDVREVDIDDFNVNDDLISICSRVIANENNFSSSNSDEDFFF